MTAFYERLEQDTAAWRREFMEIPLVQGLLGEGTGTLEEADVLDLRRVYTRFLQDSYYHVRAAAKVYALAGARISESAEPIRNWLLHHAVDEYGHHEWIMDDLRVLGVDPGLLAHSRPSAWCDALVGYMYYVAGTANPIGILGDTYVIEGLSELLAIRLAQTMKAALTIPDAAVSYIAKHGEADQGHMAEFRHMVNENVRCEDDYQDVLQVARTEFTLYGAIVKNLVTLPDGAR